METDEIRRQFAEFVGKDKFEKFIKTLSTTCRERQRLLHWQEEIWSDFQQSRNLETGNTFPELAHIFDEEIQKMEVEIQEQIRKERFKHPFQYAFLRMVTSLEAIGTGAAAGGAAGLAAHYFAGSELTFPIFIVVYVLLLTRLRGYGRIIGTVSFVVIGTLVMALMKLLSNV